MRFRVEDARDFVQWSGDNQPPQGEQGRSVHVPQDSAVVRGVQTVVDVLRALGDAGIRGPLSSLEAEFRGQVLTDNDYDLAVTPGVTQITARLTAGDRTALTLSATTGHATMSDDIEGSWTRNVTVQQRAFAASLDLSDLSEGATLVGTFNAGAPPDAWTEHAPLTRGQLRILALCSYIAGMEVPGARGLLTRLTVTFARDPELAPLVYRLRVAGVDRAFRMVRLAIDVATQDGVGVAQAEIHSYVRFSPRLADLDLLARTVTPPTEATRGRVALVCGGSRGLGASLAAALALRGCKVYASHRSSPTDTAPFRQALADKGLDVECMQGDAGDPRWCSWALNTIVERHGRLDVLVLNACAAPPSVPLRPDALDIFEEYVRANLRLVQLPLTTMLPALRTVGGTVIAISSAVVGDRAPLSGASRSLKLAVEGLIQSSAAEYPEVRYIVARPGRLQTASNDTPTRVAGAMPPEWVAAAVLDRIHATEPGVVDVLSAFAEPDASLSPRGVGAGEPDFFMPIAASFTADPIVRPLEFWFERLGVRGESPLAPYGQIIQTLLDPRSLFGQNARGVNVALLRVHDWLRELPAEQWHTPDALSAYLDDTAAALERALIAHRQTAKAETLLILCPGSQAPPAVAALLSRTEQRIVHAAKGLSGLGVVLATDFHALYDVRTDDVADRVRDHMAHVPYRDPYFHVLATIAVRHASRRLLPLRKVMVVDCDNTLWRGVVGEVGPAGIAFGPAHLALHATLQRLVASGVLLCLCSKNEESDVWEAFDTRPDFTLKREAIVAATINWLPKSHNIRTLAARLNLGLDSFIFLDDNPVECAEVRAGCPEVLTLQWPQDADEAVRLLNHTWELDPRDATQEDLRRTAMYKEEFKRQELRDHTLTFQDFLDNLQLAVDIAPMSDDDVKRSSQLTLRTNQFNFTTKRRSEAELLELRADGVHEILTVRVRDRFGDYGLVGLLVLAQGDGHVLVDTFLLSCRVLGRGVEHRMAATIARRARDGGRRLVRMRVEATKKNKPARDFLLSILPHGDHDVTDAHVDARLDADWLTTLTFEPSEAPLPVDDADAAKSTAATPPQGPGFNPRQRETQIARTAALATLGDLRRAIDGEQAASDRPPGLEDVSAAVYEAFARALHMSAARVREVDSIEALGCDSFKIVEISVNLIERFPNLPSTLLFEHRTVSEIIDQIAHRSSAAAVIARGQSPSAKEATSRDVAVVGLHLRCGGARSADELWSLLSEGRSAVTGVPTDRQHFVRTLQDRRPHWGALLEDLDAFDAEFFGVSPREAESMDPQLRLFLEVAWGALEDAGNAGQYADPHTGVFVGVMYGDYVHRANRLAQAAQNPYRSWEGFSIANRLSQALGFDGPSLAIDTACSSSGTALHLACRAITDGDCRTAIVGGVNVIVDPDRFVQLGILGILSHTGRCQAFGADADGTVLGEGVGVVVLRSLAEAQARGDRIYGVIKGTGLSTGAGTVGFTAPHPRAQAEAIRRALLSAAVDPRTISYVETHGTGTALGDPIEVRGLTLAYDDRALWSSRIKGEASIRLGSIKPNIGHLEAGAGVMGLIKLMLQLDRRQLLPSLTSPALNPQIPFAQLPFDVQRTLEPWDAPVLELDGVATPMPRRAGLNSFGVGGANAHAIVEEAPETAPTLGAASSGGHERPLHVLTVSAKSQASLLANAAALARLLGGPSSPPLGDVAFTANTRREHFEHRLAVIAPDASTAASSLNEVGQAASPTGIYRGTVVGRPKLAMLFTGQGAQYAGMGRELYDAQPTFRRVLDECAAALEGTLEVPLLDVMFATPGSPAAALIHRTAYTQPALFAVEYAMGELLRTWGVKPDVVIGHSVGEIAALAWAGAMSLAEAIALVAARGRLMDALPAGGQMCSIMTTEARVSEALNGVEGVSIAAVNGPSQVVVAGDGEAVTTLAARFTAQGVRTQALTVSHAFHSHLMDPMTAEFAAVATKVALTRPRLPVVSCVTGAVLADECATPDYWVRQVRDTVRFVAGMDVLRDLGITAMVETGPHPVLLGMGRHCLGDEAGDRLWLPSLRRDSSAWTTLTAALAQLHVAGAAIDWTAFDAPFVRARVPLPAYAFTHKSYWLRATGAPGEEADDRPRTALIAPLARAPRRPTAYRLAWRQSAREKAVNPVDRQHVVVMADEEGLGDALAEALRSRGTHVTVLHHGRALVAGLVVDATDRLVLERVWHSLDTAKPAPTALVWLWGLSASMRGAASVDDVRAARQRLFDRLHAVVGSLVASPVATVPLSLVTRGGAAVEADGSTPTDVDMIQSMVWGFARTLALEHPGLWGRIVDLPADATPRFGATLADEVLSGGDEDQVALRGPDRLVPRIAALEHPDTSNITLSPDGVYIVTGGLGALGLRVAQWMAARGARHILLTSRRGALAAHSTAVIVALEARGVRVRVVTADVGSADDVATLMRVASEHGASVRGIVHAAGTDLVAPMAETTRAQFDTVAAAKVEGTWLLAEVSRQAPLDFFLCFSSIAAVLGSAGRAAYAAANAAQDALPYAPPRDRRLVCTIAWGPWAGGGMADAQSLRELAAIGNHGLDPDAAIAAMEGILARRVPHATIVDIEWDRFKPVYEARRRRPLVADVHAPEASVTSGTTSKAAPSAWGAMLVSEPPERRRDVLTSLLATEVASTLGLRGGEEVPSDKTFHQMGMDSLLAVQFGVKLETHLGFRSTSLVFDYPRLSDLTTHVLERLSPVLAGGEPHAPSAAERGVTDASSEWMEALAGTPSDQRLGRLEALLKEEIAHTLGFASPAAIDESKTFSQLGMDSLLAVQFAARLERRLGVRRPSVVFDHPTLPQLAGYLLGEVDVAEAPSTYGLVKFTAAMEADVLAFQQDAFTYRRPELIAPRWRWMFKESAARLGLEPRVWLFRDADRIVAHHGALPVRLKAGDAELTTAWWVDTKVRDEYQSEALGPRLVLRGNDDLDFSLSLGQTKQMRDILLLVGHVQVAPLETAQLLLEPHTVLSAKMFAPAAMAAAIGLQASSAVRSVLRTKLKGEVAQVTAFDARHDELWRRAAKDLHCAVVRDASYLNWKYVTQPGQQFTRLEIVEDGRTKGVVVLMFRKRDDVYPYDRAFIVDLVAPVSDKAVMNQLIGVAIDAASEQGAATLTCLHIGSALTRALRRNGFMIRDPQRFLLVYPGALGGDARATVLDGRSWYVTHGDSDIDRP